MTSKKMETKLTLRLDDEKNIRKRKNIFILIPMLITLKFCSTTLICVFFPFQPLLRHSDSERSLSVAVFCFTFSQGG